MFKKIWCKFLTIFGDIKVFKFPMFIIYQPKGYRVTGKETENVLNVIQDGDILVRGYYDYLDGKIIKGFFSHAGFYYGEHKVIHAIAEGVVEEHIIDFCRCDYLAILRFLPEDITSEDIKIAQQNALEIVGYKYDFEFDGGDNELYCTQAVLRIWNHKLKVTPEKVTELFGLIKRNIVFPDQLYSCDKLKKIFITSKVK